MAPTIRAWVERLAVRPGDHVIAIVGPGEDLELLPPYVRQGQEQGDLCSVVSCPHQTPLAKSLLQDHGLEPDQVVFCDPAELGGPAGEFRADAFLEKVGEFVGKARAEGVRHVRNTGLMRWVDDLGLSQEEGIYLEARLNEIMEEGIMSGLCIYDSRFVGGDTLIQLLRTHPKILLHGEVIHNTAYKRPEEILRELGRA